MRDLPLLQVEDTNAASMIQERGLHASSKLLSCQYRGIRDCMDNRSSGFQVRECDGNVRKDLFLQLQFTKGPNINK